jgi:hypothetical protein
MTQLLTRHPARHPNQTAKAVALAHLVFERPDLALAERILSDFGLKPCSKTDSAILPEKKKWEIFSKVRSKRPQYLKPGQVVEASIRSVNGRVDLGMQRNRIAEEG